MFQAVLLVISVFSTFLPLSATLNNELQFNHARNATIEKTKKDSGFDSVQSMLTAFETGVSECKNGQWTQNEKGYNICKCNTGYVLTSEGDCIACHCNNTALQFDCELIPLGDGMYDKKCICGDGYSEIRKKCIECGCGKGFTCTFKKVLKKYEKTCHCYDGYVEYKSQCKKLCSQDSDCLHGGVCKNDDEHSFCSCRKNLSGDSCETITQCDEVFNPACVNSGGTCMYNVSNEAAYCECPAYKRFSRVTNQCEECGCGKGINCTFREGKNKEEKACHCHDGYGDYKGRCRKTCSGDSDCLHGGMCKNDDEHSFCSCRKNLSGDSCETIVQCDEVFNPACVNSGGTCVYNVSNEAAYCECPAYKSFSRDTNQCEEKHSCFNILCPNNTRCTSVIGIDKCILCEEGYRPVDMNLPIEIYGCTEVCHNESCIYGKCEANGYKYECKCDKGFTGQQCQISVSSALEFQAPWIAVACALLLAFLVAVVAFFRHRKDSGHNS